MKARRGARGLKRTEHVPSIGLESELEVRTEDGVRLAGVVLEPEVAPKGTAIMAHAMFARRATFVRGESGLAAAFTARGYRVVAFDFRGHGGSKLPAGVSWGYDDLVRYDLPAVASCVRARAEGRPVVVVGHSLGGHVALAGLGTGVLDVDGVLAIAANVWMRRLERSHVRWGAKRVLTALMAGAVRATGRFPARRLRMGSDDEPAEYMTDLLRGAREGRWGSADGRHDYLAAMANVRAPLVAVLSAGDTLNCHPDAGERFARLSGGPVEVFRVARSDDGSPPPDHAEIVITPKARSAILGAEAWLSRQLSEGDGRAPARQARP